jgi:hypothetical protein
MITKALICFAAIGLATCALADPLEIRDVPVSGWPCLNQPSGTAKTPDGVERNAMKNRAPVNLSGARIESLDTTGFLRKVAAYDAELRAQRRTQLSAASKQLLEGYEKQLVSVTGYLVLAYPGPPETCNCGDANMHDWHLEVFEKPADHGPEVGDPTPIICEITPRTEQLVYRSGVRLQSLAGFFRAGKQDTSTGHAPQRVKVTGFLMWDDEHNGSADIGGYVQYFTPGNGFHHPWRSTAWEIHPVISIQALPSSTVPESTVPPPARPDVAASIPPNPPSSKGPEMVTITVPTKIKVPYGETVLPRGARVEVVSTTASTVTIRYLGSVYTIPISSTNWPGH